jgi:Protein of unknown function (DUF1501)
MGYDQEYEPGNQVGWDDHTEVGLHTQTARVADRRIHGLLTTLKSRGMLDDTRLREVVTIPALAPDQEHRTQHQQTSSRVLPCRARQ